MGFVSDLFGGSKQKSSSTQTSQSTQSNQAFDFLKNTYGGTAQTGVGASNAIAALLGLGGDADAASAGFQNYLNSTGYNFQLGQGQRALASSNAASGLLNSGSAAKALTKYGQNIGANAFQNYLSNLSGVANQGVQAGQLISGAGNVGTSSSSGSSSSKGSSNDGLLSGLGGLVGGIAGFFSDERLKKDMKHWATDKNGIRYYTWEWNEKAKKDLGLPEGKQVGVSAQELRGTKWEKALGERDGYTTVKYWMLPDANEKEAA